MAERSRQRGFTLIEAIVVITLIGALAVVAGLLIVEPFRASDDINRRARLTDQADLVVDRIVREVRSALPNSVRVTSNGSRTAVEFVPTRTGGRYRRLPAPGGGSDRLNRAQSSDTFDVLGRLPDLDAIVTGGGGTACTTDATDCINIYNTGQAGFDVYEGDNIAEITQVDDGGTPNDFSDDRLSYANGGASPAFRAHSPAQRFFVFNDVVSFVCDGSRLLRFATYGLQSSQPISDADFGVGARVVADDLATCDFAYDPGTATRQGLLEIDLALAAGGETVSLFAQAHVVNAP